MTYYKHITAALDHKPHMTMDDGADFGIHYSQGSPRTAHVFNTYAVMQASLRIAHGPEVIEEKLSDHHLMNDVAATYVGMDIAVPEECWETYRAMPVGTFAKSMIKLAHRVKLARYPKKKRGPKKPQPRKKSRASKSPHLDSQAHDETSRENTLKGVDGAHPTLLSPILLSGDTNFASWPANVAQLLGDENAALRRKQLSGTNLSAPIFHHLTTTDGTSMSSDSCQMPANSRNQSRRPRYRPRSRATFVGHEVILLTVTDFGGIYRRSQVHSAV